MYISKNGIYQRTVLIKIYGTTLAATLNLIIHQNVPTLILFYRYYFGRCSSEMVEMVQFPCSCGRCNRYFNKLHDFSVNIPRCDEDVYVMSLFSGTDSKSGGL